MEAEKRRVRAAKRFGRADFLRMGGAALTGSALAMQGTNPAGAEQSAVPRLLFFKGPDDDGDDPITDRTPYIVDHADYIQSLPFDGMVVNVSWGWFLMRGRPISYRAIYDELRPLEDVFTRFRYNFAKVNIRNPGNVFDDEAWTVTTRNWANAARAVRMAGFRGIFFDNEEYFDNEKWMNYPEDYGSPTKSLQEYRNQTRLRGRQIMRAVVREFPGIEVFHLHGPYISEQKTPAYVTRDQVGSWRGVELHGPFFAGFVEGAGSKAKMIDGGEVYQYRTAQDFRRSYRWRKQGMASPTTNCAFIPLDLRRSWQNRVEISFGVYNQSWPDPEKDLMNPAIARRTLTNALRRCDAYVWFYAERDDWLVEGDVSKEWVEAVRRARQDAQSGF